MKIRTLITLFALVTFSTGAICSHASDNAQSLPGKILKSPEWGSGCVVLSQCTDFRTGDLLKIKVGGTAKKVILRLLPKGESPDSSTGVVGGPMDVPPGRVIEVALPEDRLQVTQISVHGGANPWGEFPLGEDNGPATLLSASVVRKQ